MPEYSDILVTERDGTVVVTLNRPEARNALSDTMMRELRVVIDDVAARRGQARALVLRGAGSVFCAGGDLKSFRAVFQGGRADEAQIASVNRGYGTLLSAIDALPCVVIAAVHGAAMAGGFGLTCVADVTIATADTRFALTETTLGLPPAQISPFILARIGVHHGRRLMLTAARIDATEALGLSLVDEVVEDAAALDAAVARTLARVVRCAPGANALTKELILAARSMPLEELLDLSAARFATAMLAPEAAEGVAAFLDKRKPGWDS